MSPAQPRIARAAATLVALPFLFSLSTTPLQAQERHVLTGAAATIWNLAGEVRLEAGTGSDVTVEVTRGGSDGAKLDIVASGGQLKIRYPSDEVVYRAGRDYRSSSTVQVRSDGTFNGDWGMGGHRTVIRTYGSGLEAHADLVVKVPAGKRLELNLAVGNVTATNVDGDLRIDVGAADVTATGTKGRLFIDAGSGTTRVENASGDLDVDVGSGSTTLSGLKMTTVTIDAGSGGLDLRDVTATRLSADIGSGSVTAIGITTDDLKLESGSGSVRFELLKVPGRADIESGSGSVTLTLPAGTNADVDIDTGSGGITSDFPVTMERMQRNELRGRIGEGGAMIRVSTGSGGVRLLKR